MEQLDVEINWLHPSTFDFDAVDSEIDLLFSTGDVRIGVVEGNKGNLWFTASFHPENVSKETLKEEVLNMFDKYQVFITFDGGMIGPASPLDN